MIHRAPFGSFERFIGILIEHFEGAFPTWLAPEQARLLPISMKHVDYARGIVDRLVAVGIRVTLDDSDERVNAKIKVGADERIPYLLVVGGRDEEAKTVSVRQRGIGDRGAIPVDEFIDELVAEVRERRLPMAAKEEV